MPSTRMRVVLALAESEGDTDTEGSRVEAYKMKLLKCIWFWKANLIQLRIYAGNVITGSKKGKIAEPCRGDLHKIDKQCQSDNDDDALFGIPTGFRLNPSSPSCPNVSVSTGAGCFCLLAASHGAAAGQTDNASAICKGLRIQRPSAGVRPRLTDALSASQSVHPFACLVHFVWQLADMNMQLRAEEERTYNFNCQHYWSHNFIWNSLLAQSHSLSSCQL